jgi:hypothetical protein
MEKKWLVHCTDGLLVKQSAQFCFVAVVYAADNISAATPKELEQEILNALGAEPLASACVDMDPSEILKFARKARPPSGDYVSLNSQLKTVLRCEVSSGASNPDFDVPTGAIRRISEAGRLAMSAVRGEGGAQGGVERTKRGGSGCGGSGRLGGAGKQQAGWAWRSERDDIARLRQKRRPPTPPPPSLRSVAAPPPLPTL